MKATKNKVDDIFMQQCGKKFTDDANNAKFLAAILDF